MKEDTIKGILGIIFAIVFILGAISMIVYCWGFWFKPILEVPLICISK